MTRKTLAELFWVKVKKTDNCWLWTGAIDHFGYGWINTRLTGRPIPTKAHRVSIILSGQRLSRGDVVMHRCDNPPCVNPDHLVVGTQAENIRDAARKGRLKGNRTRGEEKPQALFTNAQAREIRERLAQGEKGSKIAREFSVSQSTISYIKHGRYALREGSLSSKKSQ